PIILLTFNQLKNAAGEKNVITNILNINMKKLQENRERLRNQIPEERGVHPFLIEKIEARPSIHVRDMLKIPIETLADSLLESIKTNPEAK
ncbi:MAG: hypothetical protein ACXQS8_10080, partial [Candidatus Helarchaeales archaeon]